MEENKRHRRESIRLPGFDYAGGNWFYVTLCAHNHWEMFGRIHNRKMLLNEFGNIVRKEWLTTKKIRENIDLDYYVVMPNHLHGIIIITHKSEYRKSISQNNQITNEGSGTVHLQTQCRVVLQNDQTINECRGTGHRAPTLESFGKPVPGSLPTIIRSFKATVTKQINGLRGTPGQQVWQRNYFERVIRNEKELFNIRNYIFNNPCKWELEKGIPENLEL